MSLETIPLMETSGVAPTLVRRTGFRDQRGTFTRLFAREDLEPVGWTGDVVHINHSRNIAAGTVRGLHIQRPPHAEMKLVTCIRGTIWDVAVDMRKDSPTRFAHVAVELSAETGTALLIPEGFAHGFQTLTDDVELIYLHSAAYAPDAADGCRPDDPALAINWPMPMLKLSDADMAWPLISRELA